MAGVIWSIGQGRRGLPQLIAPLQAREIRFLLDVRSAPWSGVKPEFSREPLAAHLRGTGLRYLYLGDTLGGRPSDPSCYVGGRVDYAITAATPRFQRGLARLVSAWEQGHQVCLFCSEGDPERCHRSKLIGVALAELGVEVQHIGADDSVRTQSQVMQSLSGGQLPLLSLPLRSTGSYR